VTAAVVNIFIDPERGFLDASLTEKQGGVLYVPQGEEVSPVMGDIIAKSRNTTFILGQDYHPANHISFMTNHPGVMAYRVARFRDFLAANGQPVPVDDADLRLPAQQPVHFFGQNVVPFPFEQIVLDGDRNIIGVKEDDGHIRKVVVETTSGLAPHDKDRGRVVEVLGEYFGRTFDEYVAAGALLRTQTLWTTHCVQGTDSSLYPAEMNLPQGLTDKLNGDLMSATVYHRDAQTGNEFYVVRKGANSEVDSYGIGVENDGETMTGAWDIFRDIAQKMKQQGVTSVDINIGGLATNFCVEFSANNTADFLAGHFKMRGMDVNINFVPEISRGIPVPGGVDTPFSLAGTEGRLKASRNIGTATVAAIVAKTTARKPPPPVKPPTFGR
jgi:nicotinamidase-related amidase